MFNHNCGQYQGTILNKISVFKVNTGWSSESESPVVLLVDPSGGPSYEPSYVPSVNPSRAPSYNKLWIDKKKVVKHLNKLNPKKISMHWEILS